MEIHRGEIQLPELREVSFLLFLYTTCRKCHSLLLDSFSRPLDRAFGHSTGIQEASRRTFENLANHKLCLDGMMARFPMPRNGADVLHFDLGDLLSSFLVKTPFHH